MSDPGRAQALAVLTSGGDSAGMNAAVRGVVRTALAEGVPVFTISEGLQGLVDGGDRIRRASSKDVSGILQLGGTVLGTARSADFRTRDGLRRACANLIRHGITGLVVVGGDGSLSGADELRTEWPGLVDELVAAGELDPADSSSRISLAGVVGSIDNDMFGTEMTVGADTALHRITEAIDAIQSTASSHQRTFVIEVMGRHCGYLALMASLATGADFVLIPENPPSPGWDAEMCGIMRAGREIGRRASIVIVAEGATDTERQPISVHDVKACIEEHMAQDTRVTILGHVQRGGAPSAFDRYLGTVLGHAAACQVLEHPDADPVVVGIRGQTVVRNPLDECVATTRSVAGLIAERDYTGAMALRGRSFATTHRLIRTLVQARPRHPEPGQRVLRLGVLHAGGPAPGMNTAVRVAVRVGMDHGHRMLAVRDGLDGLLDGNVEELSWMAVSGWVSRPGAALGTSRLVPDAEEAAAIAARVDEHALDGLLLIGGWAGYEAAHALVCRYGLETPIVCIPATINNDLPGTDLSIGADTALNSIMSDVDKIKESAVASHRCFVVEVMGRDCGYLALMSGLATGAERIHLPEVGLTLDQLREDLDSLKSGFRFGKRRGLVVHGEGSDSHYTTAFLEALYSHESEGLFDVRSAILGHVQQGGAPTPFDRIHASRLAAAGIDRLIDLAGVRAGEGTMFGVCDGETAETPLDELPYLVEDMVHRPRGDAWWMELLSLAGTMSGAPTSSTPASS